MNPRQNLGGGVIGLRYDRDDVSIAGPASYAGIWVMP